MAKKRSRRGRRRRFAVCPVNAILPLLATADAGVVKLVLLNNVEDVYWTSADLSISLRDFTAGEGPVGFGCVNDDLTAAEIVEAVAAAPTGPDDIIQNERARRPVRDWGQFPGLAGNEGVGDNLARRYLIKMAIGENSGFSFWAQNRSGAAFTTGAEIIISGKLYGYWR